MIFGVCEVRVLKWLEKYEDPVGRKFICQFYTKKELSNKMFQLMKARTSHQKDREIGPLLKHLTLSENGCRHWYDSASLQMTERSNIYQILLKNLLKCAILDPKVSLFLLQCDIVGLRKYAMPNITSKVSCP